MSDMRLIDADKMKADLLTVDPQFETMIHWCITVLDAQPTIEPERKVGKWIPVDSYSACGGDEATWMVHGNPIAFYYCSECKEQAYADENGESILSKFCPNCGAEMKEEQDD